VAGVAAHAITTNIRKRSVIAEGIKSSAAAPKTDKGAHNG